MTNEERKAYLKVLTDLYSSKDFDVALTHMPTEVDDPSGSEFTNYFDFLQGMYSLRGDFLSMDEPSISSSVGNLIQQAQAFGYPTNMLESL
jgi:hypothetical protein